MKVGIFADSYGDHKPEANGMCWAEMLEKTYGVHVVNHSASASSIWYSYHCFKMHQQKYEKIVFLITGDGRFTVPLPPNYSDPRLKHISGNLKGFQTAIKNKDYKNDLYLKNVNDALEKYYAYLHDPEKDRELNRLMYEEIKRIRPDTLFIPCFKDSPMKNNISLWDVHEIDIIHYQLPEDAASARENRHCHMNQENNAILAGKVYDWLQGKEFVLDPADFKTPTASVDYYFLKN